MAKFSNADVGDRLWSLEWNCWGTITTINYNEDYPLFFMADDGGAFTSLNYDGKTQEDGLVVFYWNEVHLPTDEEDRKPFDLVDYLKQNLRPKKFIHGERNWCLSYSKDKEYKGWETCYDEEYHSIGCVYFYDNNINDVVKQLIKYKTTTEELIQALKQLGWL